MSGELKATPGPWEAADHMDGGNSGDAGCYGVREASSSTSGYVIADVWGDTDDLEPHAKANAFLIAAAPELYSALEDLVGRAESEICDPIDVPQIQWAKTVMAKARGESR